MKIQEFAMPSTFFGSGSIASLDKNQSQTTMPRQRMKKEGESSAAAGLTELAHVSCNFWIDHPDELL